MTELVNFILSTWHDEVLLYQGYFSLFIAAILYLYCTEKKTKLERGLMEISIALIMLFCFLPFVQISISVFIERDKYFRMLWLLPVLPVLGIVFVKYMDTLKMNYQKFIWVCFCVFCLWCAGNCVYFQAEWYESGYSSKNPYLEEQVEISVILDALEGDKVVVAQEDFLPVIRQVSGNIKLLYGEDIEIYNYDPKVKAIYELMKAEEINMDLLLQEAEKQGVTYIIFAPQWDTMSKSVKELQSEGKLDIIYETAHYSLINI